jgi:hypothetical protein
MYVGSQCVVVVWSCRSMDRIMDTQLTTWKRGRAREQEYNSQSLVGERLEQHPHHLHLHLQVLDVGRGVSEQVAEPARLVGRRHQPPELPHLLHQPGLFKNNVPLARRRPHRHTAPVSSHPQLPLACSTTFRLQLAEERDDRRGGNALPRKKRHVTRVGGADRVKSARARICSGNLCCLHHGRGSAGERSRTCMREHDTHSCAGAASRCACTCRRREPPTKAAGAAYSNGAVAAVGETRPVVSDAIVPLPLARTDPATRAAASSPKVCAPPPFRSSRSCCLCLLVGATYAPIR